MTVLWDRTHCSRGHEMTSDNTGKNGRCRACCNEKRRTLRARRIGSGGACPRCSTPFAEDTLYVDGKCIACTKERAKAWAEGVKVRGWTRTQCYRGHDLTIGKNVTGNGRCRVCRLEGHRKRRESRLLSGDPCPSCGTKYSDETLLPDGRCRPCANARCRRWTRTEKGQASITRAIAETKRRYQSDPDFRRRVQASNRRNYFWLQYGIRASEAEARLAEQGDRCAVCRKPAPEGKKLHLDHDHRCCSQPGKSCGRCVREFLCGGCNVAIGFACDDPALLHALGDYVARHRARILGPALAAAGD